MSDAPQASPPPAFSNMIIEIRKQIRKDLYAGKLQYDSSISMLQRHLKVCEEQDYKLLAGQLSETLGTIALERGNFTEAADHYKTALTYVEKLQDSGSIGVMLNNIGEVYRRSGDAETATDYYIQARNLARQSSRHSLIITTYNNQGQTELANGNIEQAIDLLKNGLVTHSDSGEWNLNTIKSTLPEIHSSLGEAHARQGDFAEAWKNVKRALDLSQEFQQVQQIARAYKTMAFIAIAEKNFDHDILHYLQESQRHWDLLNAQVEIARVNVLKGDYFRAIGEDGQANEAYTQAIEHLDAAELNREAEEIREKLD